MKKIYKYELEVKDRQLISMPIYSDILDIQVQHDNICMWVYVPTENDPVNRIIECFGTGQEVDATGVYIATVQYHGFVWHFFDCGFEFKG